MDDPSVYAYNPGDDLRSDASRNASACAVKYAIATALANAAAGQLATVIKAVATSEKKAALVETSLSGDYLKDRYSSGTRDKRQEEWKEALKIAAGDDGVATTGLTGVASHIVGKGYKPFVLPANWVDVLKDMDAPTEDKVLSASEKAGEVLSDPTEDMVKALDEVWGWLTTFEMTNGKDKPPVKGFMTVMDAGTQKRGEYRDGTVLIHTDIGTGRSPLLLKVMLEEVVHHVTGAGDMSRDLQDFLFRLVVQMAK